MRLLTINQGSIGLKYCQSDVPQPSNCEFLFWETVGAGTTGTTLGAAFAGCPRWWSPKPPKEVVIQAAQSAIEDFFHHFALCGKKNLLLDNLK